MSPAKTNSKIIPSLFLNTFIVFFVFVSLIVWFSDFASAAGSCFKKSDQTYFCQGTVSCANGTQGCWAICPEDAYALGTAQLYCNPDPTLIFQCRFQCNGGGGGNTKRPAHVWVRVLSKDGPNGKPIAWKGNNVNDKVWDTTWNPDWVPNQWSGNGLDGSGNFQSYQAVSSGSPKNWDLNRNKISNDMNFTTNNITQPVVWYTEQAEYWSNHFCIGGKGYQLNGSNPTGLTKINEYGRDAYCDLTSANSQQDIWCQYQDVDGCWTYPPRRSADHYLVLKPLLDYANNNPSRGSLGWADLRYDEYWTLYFMAISGTDTEFTLSPPTGYTCKDVRWFKNNDSGGPTEETPGSDYNIVPVPNTNWCQVKNFQPSDDGNLFIFEVESSYQTITGKVVNSQTGSGLYGVQVSVQKLNASNQPVGSPSIATTDVNGTYTVSNYIGATDRYTVSLVTTSFSGYIGNGYAINSNQNWGSYIRKGYNIGYTWNHGASVDTKIGDTSYVNQRADLYGCNGANPDLGGAVNRCWFAFDPPYTVSGRVVDYRTGAGIGGVSVVVQRLNASGVVIATSSGTSFPGSDPNLTGNFMLSNFVGFGDKYRVYVPTPPSGFQGSGYALKYNHAFGYQVSTGNDIPWSWNHNKNPELGTPSQGSFPWGNTLTRDATYDGQKPGGADCSGSDGVRTARCWFTFDIAPPPPTTKVAGFLRIDYPYTTNADRKKVARNEFNQNYTIQVAKNSVWENVTWVPKTGSVDCIANYPDGVDLPNCANYFASNSNYLEGEYFTARLRLPNNKYNCYWEVVSAEPNPSAPGTFRQVVWASGAATSRNGETYCQTNTLRVESVAGAVAGMETPMHANFRVYYESNRLIGRVFDAEYNTLTMGQSGIQIVKYYPNGTKTGYITPGNLGGGTWSYPLAPLNDLGFADFFKSNENAGFRVENNYGTYKCGWIFDRYPNSTILKSSASQFKAAYGAAFDPQNFSTYPAETTTLKRGMDNNCSEVPGILTMNTNRYSPLNQNQLYVFRLDKLGRFSGRVNMNYPYMNGVEVNQNRNISYDELGQSLAIQTGVYNNANGQVISWSAPTWNRTGWNCSAKYPNNTELVSGLFGAPSPACNDFFVSADQYLENGQMYKAVARLRFKPGKYTCTTTTTGTSNITTSYLGFEGGVEYEYCETLPFDIQSDPNGVLTTNSEWPIKVNFNLAFKDNSVVATVFNKTTPSTAYGVNGESGQNGYYQSNGGYQYYIVPSDNADGWASGATANISLTGDISNKICYYYTKETTAPYPSGEIAANAPVSIVNWNGIYNGFNPARNGMLDTDCLNMSVPIRSGPFSPAYHNQVYIFVAPKLYIGPSTIRVVNGSDRCSEVGTLVSGNTTVTLTPSFPQGIGSSAVFGGGNFDFLNTPLYYNYGNGVYQINFSVDGMNLNDYGICPTSTNPTASNPVFIDVPQLLPNYPDITDAQTYIDASIQFYRKDMNKWWQVYNGGVYVSTGNLSLNLTASGEGMPADAVIVGNGNASTTLMPNDHAHGVGYSGALVSPDTINPSGFNRFGITPKDWGLLGNGDKMNRLDLQRIYDDASKNWKTSTDLNATLAESSSEAVYVNADVISVGSGVTYSRDKNKIILVSDQSGSSTVSIDANVSKGGFNPESGVIILLVRGNVVIAPEVTNLRMVIYATGTIRVQSGGNDVDEQLFTVGGLYSDVEVIMDRDLQDVPRYEKAPAVKVVFPAEIFNKMDEAGTSSFPSVVSESKAFWIIEE